MPSTTARRATRTQKITVAPPTGPVPAEVVAAQGGKSATGDVRPDATPAAEAAPAPAATTATPPKEKAAPKGLPILPVRGAKQMIKDATGFVAVRELVGTTKAPAIRLFTGELAPLAEVGATFDSHHRTNHAPCGIWVVVASLKAGEVTGKLPEGTKALAVNAIG